MRSQDMHAHTPKMYIFLLNGSRIVYCLKIVLLPSNGVILVIIIHNIHFLKIVRKLEVKRKWSIPWWQLCNFLQVSEVSRRGWNEASRAWGSGGAGMGTLTLTGSSGGPHERSSLLLGPGDGYQRLDNNRWVGSCSPTVRLSQHGLHSCSRIWERLGIGLYGDSPHPREF